ncbi:MAG: M17 family peptidase N-terminal domain-containing protein, partial [Luteibacter sp.]
MTVQFSLGSNAPESTATPVAVVGVYENGVLTSAAARIDTAAGGAIKRLVEAGDITGKVGNLVTLLQPAGIAAARVLVVGLGAQKTFDAARYQRVTLEAARAVGRLPVTE